MIRFNIKLLQKHMHEAENMCDGFRKIAPKENTPNTKTVKNKSRKKNNIRHTRTHE